MALYVQNGKIKLVVTQDQGVDKVTWEGTVKFIPLVPTDTVTPEKEDVIFSFRPQDKPDAYVRRIPAGGLTKNANGFSINDIGRQVSGIDQFDLTTNADGTWSASLKDVKAVVMSQSYALTCFTLQIGDDSGTDCEPLSPVGATWIGN